MLCVMILSWQYSLFAQSSSTLIGARAAGMAYSSSALTDEWSAFNNVAGLAKLTSMVAAFTYDVQPSFTPFNKAAATFSCPLRIGVAGLGLYHFGDDLYNEQLVTLGYSSTLGLASLGVQVNYIQYNIQGFGRKAVLTASFGGIAELTKRLSLGAHVININQPKLSELDEERIPTVLIAGVLMKTSDDVTVTAELEKDLDHNPAVKAGIEYRILKKFFLRTGIRIQPNTGYFGFGFKPARYCIDYAFQYNQGIGSRHQASVSYKLNNKTK
jgi:hypothetical protein